MHDKKIIDSGGFVAKVEPYLQSACAAKVCGGLGILALIQYLLESFNSIEKINVRLSSDC